MGFRPPLCDEGGGMMTQGEIAYREDVRRRDVYPDGQPRRDWFELCELVRSTWEKNPTAREWEKIDG